MKKNQILTVLLTIAVIICFAPSALTAAYVENPESEIPETHGGILREIKAKKKALAEIIDDEKLGDVHDLAFAIRNLVNALPEKSPDLDPEKQGKLGANVEFVTALTKRLEESSDANDLAATQANFTNLRDVLDNIESLYPEYRRRIQHHSSRRHFRNQ